MLTRAALDTLSATDALWRAGFKHRRAADVETTGRHDIIRVDTGEVVASLRAWEAHDFAARKLGITAP